MVYMYHVSGNMRHFLHGVLSQKKTTQSKVQWNWQTESQFSFWLVTSINYLDEMPRTYFNTVGVWL